MVDISNRGFLSRLSPATAAELIEAAPTVHYPAGSIIFSPRNGTTSGLVVSGLIRYYIAGSEGRELTIRYVVAVSGPAPFSRENAKADSEPSAISTGKVVG